MPEFQTALRQYREGTFVFVPELFVDDGARSMDSQGQTLEAFRGVLKELEIPYLELGEEIKDLQARVAFAKALIKPNGTNTCLLENGPECSYHGPWQR